uniref:Uncharacterized protein n=1 Tax=Utricularia reniformis TaxID=192314 RepID=A0A1Y0B4W3_9LAMI|nr:hypothetical protein AEK19_MT0343 [Utricularia reniformis]YP_009382730.1 hypothetical protein AEK19_MT2297 [Utricularia reniformis]ART30615.1 hypothetical protein AEK19_MT0343 [Utricularia reniformis]ART32440.1 hypothetical protein AEK19_MT2297 [Utricularia reniformis]
MRSPLLVKLIGISDFRECLLSTKNPLSSLPYLDSRCLLGLLSYLITAFTGSGLACVIRKTTQSRKSGSSWVLRSH